MTLAFVVGAILASAIHPSVAQADGANAEFVRLLQAGTTESLGGDLVHAAADLEEAVALEPQNAEGWFQLGLLYSKATSFRKAEAAFRKAVELNPHFAEAHFRLGWTLIVDPPSKLDWAGAVSQCRAALADKPDYADALDLLGTGLTNLGELEKAVEVLQQAAVVKPASAATHFNLALALEKLGLMEKAEGEYEAAIAARRDYPEVHSALGKLLLTMGEPSEAEQELRKALQLNPDLGDAHYALARAMQALKETSAVKIELAESADLTRRQSDANQSVYLSNEGLATATRGDLAGAVKSMREAVALKPDYGVPHFNLGLLLADTGDMKGALRELNVAISLMPGQAKPWFELGRVYERLGDSRRASEAISWAARLAPSDAAMQAKVKSLKLADTASAGELNIPEDTAANHESAAEALLRDGQPMDAVGESLRALTLAPADVNVRRTLARAYESLGNIDRVALEHQKLLLVAPQDTVEAAQGGFDTQHPEETPARPQFEAAGVRGLIDPGGYSAPAGAAAASGLIKGVAGIERSGNDSATSPKASASCALEPALQKALNEKPESGAANLNLGEFYLAHGQTEKATPLLERARSLNKGDQETLRSLAEAYLKESRFDVAEKLLTTIPESGPETHRLLAQANEGMGRFTKASQEYQLAANQQPSEENLFGAGYELILAGLPKDAEQAFENGVTRYPQSIQLLIGLGSGQFLAGHTSASIQTLVKAAKIDPANPGPYPFLADASAISTDNAEKVEAAFAGYLRVAPNDARASYDYALNLLRRAAQPGEDSDVRAEALLQQAVALDPALADAHFQLGVIYGRRGAHDQAVSELESAVRLSPNFKDAHYRLALAYQQTGRADLSAKEMQSFRAAQERPQSANIDQLISVIHPGDSTASRGVLCPGDSP